MTGVTRLTVVTGGGRGIGAAVARRLAAEGHDLVLGYARDADAAEATADAARAAGATCRTFRADVSDPEEVDALFDAAAEWGQVTGLVNNAGATLHIGDLVDTPVDVVRRVIEVNLTGAVLVARRALRDMDRGAAIVNVSSAAATLGAPHEYVHYAAAKAGIDALTVGLAAEVAGRGIRVNAVAPGTVRTEIHAGAGDPGRADRLAAGVPLGRAGEPDEVAEAVAWLLGDACPFATGAVLRVAGGR
ncbi:SDR family oxidoreductase [Nocardioides mesophilus]|uniref:SDR family oxidoreductase n=1 Tax=Nocardioides mesophilus TaxID=433659 RepID=A0A7G9RAG2_9ACTN|nr:SDR family oxidoreductase [Nocardioides mesophilus]QNN52587.1 SDR family oxidoreductase [Nocardioides mesophilus]